MYIAISRIHMWSTQYSHHANMSEFHTRKAKTFTFFTVDTNLYARKVTFFQAQEPMKGRKNALHKAKVSLYLHHTLKLKMKKSGKKKNCGRFEFSTSKISSSIKTSVFNYWSKFGIDMGISLYCYCPSYTKSNGPPWGGLGLA